MSQPNQKAKWIDLLLHGAAQVLTCTGVSASDLGVLNNGWVAVSGERIIGVGEGKETFEVFKALESIDASPSQTLDVSGKVVAPGFVDCHTHLVFGGSRVDEYIAKLPRGDMTMLERRNIKTGLEASMDMTREATAARLFEDAKLRLNHMLLSGTTTAEIKSGYGFTTEHELRMLRVIRQLKHAQPIELHPTFLGAHGWPADMRKSDYLRLLLEEMIPEVGRSGLATACDVWCDEGYYTAAESERILSKALSMGMKPKIHTDAYSYIRGSDLAADMKMLSADHLNYTPFQAMEKLAAAGVPGVLLPGTDFNVNHPNLTDPGLMLKAGMTLALGTNLNPGNYIESMPFILILACKRHGMTPEEAIRAATRGGATALGLESDRGTIEPGKRADLQIWDTDRYENIIYRQGTNLIDAVIKNGRLVVDTTAIRREIK